MLIGSSTACFDLHPIGSLLNPMASGLSQYYWASSPSYSYVVVVQEEAGVQRCWLLEIFVFSVVCLVGELVMLLLEVHLFLAVFVFEEAGLLLLEKTMLVPLL